MAHYSSDCWDAEIETSLGWVECVGIADRSAFDLTQHSIATGTKLVAARRFKEPQPATVINVALDKSGIGKALKKDGMALIKYVEALSDEDKEALQVYFESNESKVLQHINYRALTLMEKILSLARLKLNLKRKLLWLWRRSLFPTSLSLHSVLVESYNPWWSTHSEEEVKMLKEPSSNSTLEQPQLSAQYFLQFVMKNSPKLLRI